MSCTYKHFPEKTQEQKAKKHNVRHCPASLLFGTSGGGAAGDEQRPASEGRERRATDGCSEACLMKALTDGNDDRGAR